MPTICDEFDRVDANTLGDDWWEDAVFWIRNNHVRLPAWPGVTFRWGRALYNNTDINTNDHRCEVWGAYGQTWYPGWLALGVYVRSMDFDNYYLVRLTHD